MGLPCFFNRSSVVQRRVCPASSPRAAPPPHCLRPCAGWTASVRLRSCCWPTAGSSWREVRPPNLASSASSCGKGERRRAPRCWRLSTPAVRGCECQAVAAAGGVGSRRCWICHCRGGQPCACHPTVMLFHWSACLSAGQTFLIHTKLGGRHTLRVAIGATHTQKCHVQQAWQVIQQALDAQSATQALLFDL